MSRYWIGVASRDHVLRAVADGIAQLGHGKAAPVRTLSRGDWLAYYSPRTALEGGDPVRAYSAIGRVTDDAPHQTAQSPGFQPWRRAIRFEDAKEAPIGPLLEHLSFTRGRRDWGLRFRRAGFEISYDDMAIVARAMGLELATTLARSDDSR